MQDTRGYYEKFTVIDNRTGEVYPYKTFTIKISDPHSGPALLAYAGSVRTENPSLFRDLIALYNEACTCATPEVETRDV